jgi:thiol-disulfide isomerase/thioredoxin
MLARNLFIDCSVVTLLLNCIAAGVASAAQPTVDQALQLKPIQKDVEYDKPAVSEAAQCTIRSEKSGRQSAWVVYNPAGQVLRRFSDTNGDNKVDLWCYCKGGIEVYRDVDANFNGKADQYRWLGTAGTRWGMDQNEDGRIDTWRKISAEEVTSEAVAALRTRDAKRFGLLLLSADELKSLSLGEDKAQLVSKKIAAAATAFAETVRQGEPLSDDAQWLHFGGALPGVVPAGTEGSTADLTVYENVVAVVQTGGKHGQVYVGTLVQVGDMWRLIDAPQVLEADESPAGGGFFFRTVPPRPDVTGVADGAMNEEIRGLVEKLRRLEAELSKAILAAEQSKLYPQIAEVLEQLVEKASREKDQTVFIRQYADTLSAATQSGAYPDGAKQLQALFDRLKKENADREILAFVNYRSLEAAYSLGLQTAKPEDYEKIQQQWLKDLNAFVKLYPTSIESAEALIQLAVAQEFEGKETEAKALYGKIVSGFPKALQAKKASGAIRRLECVGKPIPLKGVDLAGKAFDLAAYRGKPCIVQYWATWCEPCKRDMDTLAGILKKYGPAKMGVVGVSLDPDRAATAAHIQQKRLPWPQLHESGGMNSRYAAEMGILTLPAMFLIDSQGKVVSRNLHISQVEDELKKLLR